MALREPQGPWRDESDEGRGTEWPFESLRDHGGTKVTRDE